MKRKIFWYLSGGLAFFVIAAFIGMIASLYVGPRIIDLRYVDKIANDSCARLLKHPLVKSKDVRFFVYFGKDIFPKEYNKINAFSLAGFVDGKPKHDHMIVFNPTVIKSGCIEMAAAHELGHIDLETTDELAVDKFSADVLGSKKAVRDCLIKAGEPSNSPRILALGE